MPIVMSIIDIYQYFQFYYANLHLIYPPNIGWIHVKLNLHNSIGEFLF